MIALQATDKRGPLSPSKCLKRPNECEKEGKRRRKRVSWRGVHRRDIGRDQDQKARRKRSSKKKKNCNNAQRT